MNKGICFIASFCMQTVITPNHISEWQKQKLNGLIWCTTLTSACGYEEHHRYSVRITSLQAETWTQNLVNIRQELCPLNHAFSPEQHENEVHLFKETNFINQDTLKARDKTNWQSYHVMINITISRMFCAQCDLYLMSHQENGSSYTKLRF